MLAVLNAAFEAASTVSERNSAFFVQHNVAQEGRIVNVVDFLLDFIVVLFHLLLSYVSWIKVVLHELFYPSKLQVLVHQFRGEVRVHPM